MEEGLAAFQATATKSNEVFRRMGDALGTAGVGTDEIISSLAAGLGTGGIATCIERGLALTAVMLRAAELAGSGSATAKCGDEGVTEIAPLQEKGKAKTGVKKKKMDANRSAPVVDTTITAELVHTPPPCV